MEKVIKFRKNRFKNKHIKKALADTGIIYDEYCDVEYFRWSIFARNFRKNNMI